MNNNNSNNIGMSNSSINPGDGLSEVQRFILAMANSALQMTSNTDTSYVANAMNMANGQSVTRSTNSSTTARYSNSTGDLSNYIQQNNQLPSAQSNQSRIPISGPLCGIVACLSGQPGHIKTEMNGIITQLGGRTVNKFDQRCVTHLVLQRAENLKVQIFTQYKHTDWAKQLSIVHTSWVHNCNVQQARACESDHRVIGIEKVFSSDESDSVRNNVQMEDI